MIQEISPSVFDNRFEERPPEPDSYAVFVRGRALLADLSAGDIRLPLFSELTAAAGEFIRLFSVDGRDFYLCVESCAPEDSRFGYVPARELMWMEPRPLAFASVVACQLGEWYACNRFCGRCGAGLERSRRERMLLCPACGNAIYPKISPAVIVAVFDGDRLLLTKYAGRGEGSYALVAGFAEIGETIEDTVRREVFEETGLRVKDLRFYKSQPWPLSDSLLMGFWCRLDGPDKITMDETELAVAEWVRRCDIPERDGRVSLTGEMINYFKEHGGY